MDIKCGTKMPALFAAAAFTDKRMPLASMDANAVSMLAHVASSKHPSAALPLKNPASRASETNKIKQLTQELNELMGQVKASEKERAKLSKKIHTLQHRLTVLEADWTIVRHENENLKTIVIEQNVLYASRHRQRECECNDLLLDLDANEATMTTRCASIARLAMSELADLSS